MLDPLTVWSASNRTRFLALSIALTTGIALVDWTHPTYISVGFLYVIPIMLAGGFIPRPSIVLLALVCAALEELFGDLPERESVVRFILAASGFAATGLFVSEAVRNRILVAAHVKALEEQARLRRDAEEQLRALVENSPAAIVTIDGDGRILMSNLAAQDLFGPGDGPLQGRDIGRFMPALLTAVKAGPARAFHTSLQGGATRANGETFLAAAWFSTYSTSTGPRLSAIVVDFSEDLRLREDQSLDHLLRHTRVVMGALAHEVRNISAAILVAHRNLSRVPELCGNADFEALGSLVAGLERLAGDQLRPVGASDVETLDLASLLDELRVVTEPALAEDGIESSWPETTGLPMVTADRSGLMQVFLNLVRNSARAVGPGGRGRVDVRVAREGARLVVRFSDNGPGVERPDELFRPFARADGQGGLGLFVSRAIARSFGGDVVYEPVSPGACFAVSLPTVSTTEEVAYA